MNKKPENVEDYETENADPCNQAGPHIMDIEGESREDDDSDDDYDSILRPAFLVEGEPDLDSGPPEDGFEYLRRVRWEAAQIPKVKVAKLGRSKMNKEQSVYMPQIPEIATCLDHLLPIKKWEEMFLTDFSELRQKNLLRWYLFVLLVDNALDGFLSSSYVLQERGSLLELVDPALGIQYSSEEAIVMLNVALLCRNASPTLRPSMSQMVSMLEGRTAFQDLLLDAGLSMVNSKFRAIRNHLWQRPSGTASMSCYVPCPDYSHSNEESEVGVGLLNVCSAHSNE